MLADVYNAFQFSLPPALKELGLNFDSAEINHTYFEELSKKISQLEKLEKLELYLGSTSLETLSTLGETIE